MNIGIIGSKGYFGKIVKKYFSEKHKTIPISFRINKNNDISIMDIKKIIEKNEIEIIVNCSGMVGFKKCYDNFTEAYLINAMLPFKVSSICEEKNIRFYNISTEAVFPNGKINKLFLEDDLPNPETVYGKSKYLGEVSIKNFNNSFSVRLPKLFGSKSQIIFDLYKKVDGGQKIMVANDVYSTPIHVDLAVLELYKIIFTKNEESKKIFHISGNKQISLHDLLYKLIPSKKKHLLCECKDVDFKKISFEKKLLISGLESSSGHKVSLNKSIDFFHNELYLS